MENFPINCRVVEVNPDAEHLEDALGITNERSIELHRMVMHALIDEGSISTMLVKLSEKCNHPNELVIISWVAHKYLSAKKRTKGNFEEFLRQFGS